MQLSIKTDYEVNIRNTRPCKGVRAPVQRANDLDILPLLV
jgi:hypothetical protein